MKLWRKTVGLTAAGLVGLLLSLVLYLDFVGWPAWLRASARQFLAERGANLEFESLRGGWFRDLRISQPTLYDGFGEDAPAMLESESLRLESRLWQWPLGRPRSTALLLQNGTLTVPLGGISAPPQTGDRLVVKLETVDLRVEGGELRIPQLTAEFMGISVAGDLLLRELPEVEISDKPLSWARLPWLARPDVQERLRELVSLAQDSRFDRLPGTAIAFSLDLDARNPLAARLTGSFDFPELVHRGIPLFNLRGDFTAADNRWQVRDLQVRIGRHDLTGDFIWNRESDELALRCAGRIDPDLALQWLDAPPPDWMAAVDFRRPPRFEIEFSGPLAQPADGRLQAFVAADHLTWQNLRILHTQGVLHYRDGHFELENGQATIGGWPSASLEIGGRGIYDPHRERVSMQVTGTGSAAPLLELSRNWPMAPKWRESREQIDLAHAPVNFFFELGGSELSPSTWTGRGSFTLNDFKFRDLPIQSLTADLRFTEGTVRSGDPLQLALAGSKDAISLDFRFDPEQAKATGTIHGRLDVKRCYRQLRLPEVRQLAWLHFHQESPRFNLDFQADLEESVVDWRAEGELAVENAEFDGFFFDSLTAGLQLAKRTLRFENIIVESPHYSKFQLDYLETDLDRINLSLAGELIGDPRHIEAFIDRGPSRRGYNRVWRDFAWPDQMPHFKIEELRYEKWPDPETRWMVEMKADFASRDMIYRGVPTIAGKARVELDLPDAVRLLEIELTGEQEEVLSGEVIFDLEHDPNWSFACRGVLDPNLIFKAVGPQTEAALADFKFSPDTRVEMQGTVWMRGGGRSLVDSRFTGSALEFFGLRLRDYDLTWGLDHRDLRWRLSDTALHGGRIAGGGSLNTFTETGRIDLELDRVGVSEMLADLTGEEAAPNLGRLTFSSQVDFQRAIERSEFRLGGNGRLKVEDGRLWEAPLLKNLGDAVGIGALGRISEITADLHFAGDRVVFSSLQTDGTIFSLEGSGEYRWQPSYVDLFVRGRALRRTAILGTVLRPLSWLFEARLQGEWGEAKWSAVPLGGLMPGSRD